MPAKEALPIEAPVHVLVVGLGIVGLAAAIECRENGHTVTAFEKSDILEPVGDCIGLAANAGRIIRRWGNGCVERAISPWVFTSTEVNIHNAAARQIMKQDLSAAGEEKKYLIPRSRLVEIMYEYAREIGVEIYLGADVLHAEDDDARVTVDLVYKEKALSVRGDCLIASDGVHSRLRKVIVGDPCPPQASGDAAFRALIDGEKIAQDPEACWILKGADQSDKFELFFGPNAQVALHSCNQGQQVSWVCVHRDSRDLLDVWTSPADPDEMKEIIQDWPVGHHLWSVIRHTPRKKFINYPLFNYSSLDHWVSQAGRMILVGDAAHPLSPAAGQGASQGIEDATAVATTLLLAGARQVPLALRVAEKIRYKRALAVQMISDRVNQTWKENSGGDKAASIPFERWIHEHDTQAHTLAEFQKVADSVKSGQHWFPTNVPASILTELGI